MTVTVLRPIEATQKPETREYRCPSCGSFVGKSNATDGWARVRCPARYCGKWILLAFERPEKEAC